MPDTSWHPPAAANEPVLDYERGNPKRDLLAAKIAEMSRSEIEIPLEIGGKQVRTGRMGECRKPHDHRSCH